MVATCIKVCGKFSSHHLFIDLVVSETLFNFMALFSVSRVILTAFLKIYFRCGTLVSGDSSGNVQFWDDQFGTLLQSNSYHKGDVNALAAAPSHNRVFSAGSDGQVHCSIMLPALQCALKRIG